MGTSTTWTDSTLLNRVSARRRQRLSGLSRSATGSALPVAIVAFIAGLVIGLPILGWWLWPIRLGNADPADLSPAYRQAYVAMVADSYALNGDLPLAEARLGAWEKSEVAAALQELEAAATHAGSPVQAKRLQEMRADLGAVPATTIAGKSDDAAAVPAVTAPGLLRTARGLAPVFLLLIGGMGLVAGAYVIYRQGKMPDLSGAIAAIRGLKLPTVRLPGARSASPRRAPVAEPVAACAPARAEERLEDEISLDQAFSILAEEIEAEDERPQAAAAVSAGTLAADATHVVGNYMVTYRHGTSEPFDTSYSIETDNGEFLGECGVGVAETFGDTSPERVCAMEIWLFDKSDIRTTTKVIASEYALQDPDTRSAVSGRGDASRAQAGQSVILDTAGLKLQVAIVGMTYAQSPDAPPKSFFQELSLELTAVQK
ncbi:MAG: hypothetical protein ACYC5O_13995 [Anaerolineae bacterium]